MNKKQETLVDEFFANECPPADLNEVDEKILKFLAHQPQPSPPLILLTSGGTTVPLEKNTVRFIDNFSTGSRGAHLAQEFILHPCQPSVVFLHREGSMVPFSFHLSSGHVDFQFLKQLSTVHAIEHAVKDAQTCQELMQTHRLLPISFVSVSDYLFKLRLLSQRMGSSSSSHDKCMIVLAAAVSDFYIPHSELNVHKIQSSASHTLQLELKPVPKMLGELRHVWASDHTFCVSFKLETDESLLLSKAQLALSKYGMNMVVANELHSRYKWVKLVLPQGEVIHVNKPNHDELLEVPLVHALLTHAKYI